MNFNLGQRVWITGCHLPPHEFVFALRCLDLTSHQADLLLAIHELAALPRHLLLDSRSASLGFEPTLLGVGVVALQNAVEARFR